MRKFFAILLILESVWAGGVFDCARAARELFNLQNSIVQKAYRNLPLGAWARYSNGAKAVYVGPRKRHGITLYGIDISGGPSMQIWYRIVPKTFHVVGKDYTFLTLDPYELYLRTSRGVWFVDHSLLRAYIQMRGGRLSTILTPAEIWIPPRCEYKVEIKTSPYRLPNRTSIIATRIRSLANGAWVTASPDVPFGYVDDGTEDGGIGMRLVDFGFAGGEAGITNVMRKEAKTFAPFPRR